MYNIAPLYIYPLACKQRWVFNMLIACIPSIFIVFMRVEGLRYNVCSAWFLDIKISACFCQVDKALRKM